MQVYLEKKVDLMPSSIDSGEAVFTPEQADQLMSLAKRACVDAVVKEQAASGCCRPPNPGAAPAAMKNLFRICLEKPELAGIVLLIY
jgi:hypothetical protein